MPLQNPQANALDIASKLQFWARRYADGRMTGAVHEVNELTEQLLLQGVDLQPETAGEHKGSIWAYDGDPNLCETKSYESKYGKNGKAVTKLSKESPKE
jgi:hypothetical protein